AAEMSDRLEALVESLDVGVVLQDLEGRALAWNPSAERILGLTSDQLARRAPVDPRWQLLHADGLPLPPEDRPSRVALRTRRPRRDVTVGVRHPDARVTWASVTALPLTRDMEERPYAVAVSMTSAAEPAAGGPGGPTGPGGRYRSLIEHSPDVMTIVDAHGNVTYESPSVEAVIGFGPGELVGTSRLARVHPDDVGRALSAVTSLIGQPGASATSEYRMKARDGSWRALESVATNLLHDPDVRGLAVSTRDVTERRAKETELLATTSRLENLVQSLQAGVLVEDDDRRVVVANADLCRMFAVDTSPEALIGTDCREGTRRAARLLAEPERFVERVEELVALRRPVIGEEVVFADGRTFERDFIPVSFGGRERAHLWLYRDISRRKAGELETARLRDDAIRASRLKSEFLATMSHEIRTPMNGVIGTVELLLDSGLEQHQRDLAELVRDAGYGLLSIVNDALDLSRIEAEQLEPREAELDLASVAEGVADVVLSPARSKGLVLTVYVDPRIPERLRGDAQWLRQVLVNLAGNAVKFTDRGDVRIRAELEAQTECSATVRFCVVDTGIGIAPSERERLFDPFVQLEQGTGRRQGGTGLGLAICQRLVRLMGGELEVDSKPGRGSTFSFTLTMPSLAPAAAPPAAGRPSRGLRVLIVEPREALAAVAREYLAAWGIDAHAAASAAGARQRARAAAAAARPYDVAIVGTGDAETAAGVAADLRATPGCEGIGLVLLKEVGAPAAVPEGLFQRELTRPLKQARLYDAVVGAASPGAPAVPGRPRRGPQDEPDAAVTLPAGMRVLVADDNEVNSELLVRQLAKLGVVGEAVAGGREAVAAATSRAYDAVLMDSHMPDVDGLQAARAIRTLPGERGATPIVAVTASASPRERAACLAAGMDGFLPKPISSRALALALARAVHGRTAACEPTVIDAATIERLDAELGDRSELRRIAGIYLGQLEPGTRAIATATAAGDDDALRAAAHRLGSASATFGATQVAELCDRLEVLGAAGAAGNAGELMRALEDARVRAADELRRLLELG
ncbi:MAG: two-component system, sensor histidine kinase and response regulator, partial [Thermoleophilales bacterium]|nr:two-component system, sensor histidine kinase and response regulator [Thermoleophilales bacterium]